MTKLALVALLAGCGFELDVANVIDPPVVDAAPEAITMCTPSAPLCIGRQRVVCNATGTGVDDNQSSICPLACVDGGQCVAASNIPDDTQRGCTAAAPQLSPPPNATVQLRPGGSPGGVDIRCAPHCGGAGVTSIPSARVAQASGPPIAMFCLRSVDIPASVMVTYDPAVTSPLALLVVGNAQIAGSFLLGGTAATQTGAGLGGPAGGSGGNPAADDSSGAPGSSMCGGASSGGSGGTTVGTNASAAGGGGGGGGHAAKGGDGGQGRADANLGAGGTGGNVCGTTALTPLAGGGGGGAGGDGSCHPSECGWPGGGGGGAIQISATGTLTLAQTAVLRAGGGAGYGSTTSENGQGGGGGGGAGGAILLEAPTVAMMPAAILDVIGGNGGVSNAGDGGAGATLQLAGSPGAIQNAVREGGAGGGGAAGRIRINASNASCAIAVQPQPACTTGALRTLP